MKALSVAPVSGRIDNFATAGYSVIRHTGATAGFDFTGIAAPASGDEALVIVYFASGYNVTIKNQSTNSTAGNRIECFQSQASSPQADAVIVVGGVAVFLYDRVGAQWLLVTYIGT
ncbi:MAG: hypothetical protein ACYDH9_16710 [Limisphaerales bacterium]